MPISLATVIAHVRLRDRPNTHAAILLAEVDRLRAGIQAMLDGDYPNPRKHRPGKCFHGVNYYEDCGQCGDEWLTALLAPAEAPHGAQAPQTYLCTSEMPEAAQGALEAQQ